MAAEPLSPDLRRRYEANIWKFQLYRGLQGLSLWMPIWVIYLLDKGLSLTQITLMDAPFWLILALSEVPTGAFGDRYGRKQSVAVGTFVFAVTMLLFGLADSFLVLFVSYVTWAFAMSFQSGSDSAFLYDTLKELGKEDEFRKVLGRNLAIIQVVGAISALIGPLLATITLSLPIIVNAFTTFGAFLVVTTFTEPKVRSDANYRYADLIKASLRVSATRGQLRHLLLYSALLGLVPLVGSAIFFQPYLANLGISVGLFGPIFLLSRGAGIIGSLSSNRIAVRIGQRGAMVVVPIIVTLNVLGLSIVESIFGVALFALTSFAMAVLGPVTSAALHREIGSEMRATVMSVQSLVRSLVFMPAEPFLGHVADRWGLGRAFLVLAGFMAASMLLVLGTWPKPKREEPA